MIEWQEVVGYRANVRGRRWAIGRAWPADGDAGQPTDAGYWIAAWRYEGRVGVAVDPLGNPLRFDTLEEARALVSAVEAGEAGAKAAEEVDSGEVDSGYLFEVTREDGDCFAVTATHTPTGVSYTARHRRSPHKARASATERLRRIVRVLAEHGWEYAAVRCATLEARPDESAPG